MAHFPWARAKIANGYPPGAGLLDRSSARPGLSPSTTMKRSMDRKPTMHDVARAAGVGTMTVSRVLNRSAHVSSETAERVYKAIQSLGYRPNEVARALRGL